MRLSEKISKQRKLIIRKKIARVFIALSVFFVFLFICYIVGYMIQNPKLTQTEIMIEFWYFFPGLLVLALLISFLFKDG